MAVRIYCGFFFALMIGCPPSATALADETLLEIDADTDLAQLETRDVELTLVRHEGDVALRMAAGRAQQWPGITVVAPGDGWNLAAYEAIALVVRNAGSHPVEVGLRADSLDSDGSEHRVQLVEPLAPGALRELRLPLERRMPPELRPRLFGMRGYPGQLQPDGGIDVARVARVLVFVSQPREEHTLELLGLRADGRYDHPAWLLTEPQRLFPLIDRFGQYRHRAWPGKVASEADLRQRIQDEDADLAEHPEPADRSAYGGWTGGSRLAATGHFRVVQRDGVWWLVDPEGYLFWSHGIDCVATANAITPITDREHYFAELPPQDSPLGRFYGHASWAPHGYYQGKGQYAIYNFTASNLYRKFGDAWQTTFADRCHRRLRSWGMNTIGNWSDAQIYNAQRTPYVVAADSGRQPIEGSTGYWGKFPDPFAASFRETTQGNLQWLREAANSPWCLGVFVDNELAWGDELSLAVATLASPPQQPAKRTFLEDLRSKYGTIAQLNAAWGASHASWQALAEHREPPAVERAMADLQAFETRLAEQYFAVCRACVKELAPQTLYLGCRFAWTNDRAVRAAAQHCDVIGFNRYEDSVADFRLPEGVDMPVIIGEFHFGALDRGMFHTGLRKTANQQARAAAYLNYVRGAVHNPTLVGAHWFQFGDQATTGRGDGENYQIGFVDVCDTPYPEILAASREVGAAMYRWRSVGLPESAAP